MTSMLEIDSPSHPFLSLIHFLTFRLRRAIQSEGGRCEVVVFNRRKKKESENNVFISLFHVKREGRVFQRMEKKY